MNTKIINDFKQRESLTQTELQDAVPEVFDSCFALLLEWSTGVGKGRAIMKACESYPNNLFAVEKLNHVKNFKDDCDYHGFTYNHYQFTHYNSLKKYEGQYFDVVVLNEADTISDNAKLCLSKIRFGKLLLLTAKFNLPKKLSFWKDVCKFDVWSIPLDQAIKWGILPQPEIHVYFVRFGDNEVNFPFNKSNYYEWEDCYTYSDFQRLNQKKVNLQIRVSEEDAIKIVTNLIEYYKEAANEKGWGTKGKPSFPALCCYRYGSMRKNILSKIKLEKMKQLNDNLQGRKVIFVNDINDCFTQYHIYSKNGKKVNEENLRKFNEGEINEITAIKMLNRDMNLVDCPIALVGALANDTIELVQRIGRVLRHEHPEVHIPIVQGEKDESLLKKQLKSYISHYE